MGTHRGALVGVLRLARLLGIAAMLTCSTVGVVAAEEETSSTEAVEPLESDSSIEGVVVSVNGNEVVVEDELGVQYTVTIPDGVNVAPGMLIEVDGTLNEGGTLTVEAVFAGVGTPDDGDNGLHLGQLMNFVGTVESVEGNVVTIVGTDGVEHTFTVEDGLVPEVGSTVRVHLKVNDDGALEMKKLQVKLEHVPAGHAEGQQDEVHGQSGEVHGQGHGSGDDTDETLVEDETVTEDETQDTHDNGHHGGNHDEDDDSDHGGSDHGGSDHGGHH
jgi:hypothetical protein